MRAPAAHLPLTRLPPCLQPLGLYGFALTTALLQASCRGRWAAQLGMRMHGGGDESCGQRARRQPHLCPRLPAAPQGAKSGLTENKGTTQLAVSFGASMRLGWLEEWHGGVARRRPAPFEAPVAYPDHPQHSTRHPRPPAGFFFGGLAQFCAGLLEYQRRNTFGTVAFCW